MAVYSTAMELRAHAVTKDLPHVAANPPPEAPAETCRGVLALLPPLLAVPRYHRRHGCQPTDVYGEIVSLLSVPSSGLLPTQRPSQILN